MRSMTGFGFAEGEGTLGTYRVHIKSVNHRFLDINIRMPRELYVWEELLNQSIKSRISRGKVELRIDFEPRLENFTIEVNPRLARSYLDALETLCKELGLNFSPHIELILSLGEIIKLNKENQCWEEEWDLFRAIFEKAIQAFLESRESEGLKMKEDIEKHLEKISKAAEQLKKHNDQVTEFFRQKLSKRIAELLPQLPVNETLLAQEVVYYVERSDINEEITRIKAHVERIRSLLNAEGPVGRELEFVLQEIHREVNTIGAKSAHLRISEMVIDLKTALEKLREQVQNIE
ncbi:YicC family protein [Thermatribacter velox]|uniref:YicC family protein n=1 Tax=Thermatribacter velox TaxID=3039681 RepID=A0ABZ2YBS2_9BACT